MTTHDEGAGGDGKGFLGRTRQRLSRSKAPEDCTHPHAHLADVDGTGEQATVLVCEECGRPLGTRHDPTRRRAQNLSDAKVCVDCGGPYWTVGTRRGL